MKKLILATALMLSAPCAMAQIATGNNVASGAQSNLQNGAGNTGVNQAAADQTAVVASGPSRPGHNDELVGSTLDNMFGSGPLIENNMVIGTQMNMQNGKGNVAANSFDADQSAAGSGAGAGVGNNVAVGTQYNVQRGNNNVGVNQGQVNQRAIGLTHGPAAGLVANNIAVGTQVNVQQGNNNVAVNDLAVDQAVALSGN